MVGDRFKSTQPPKGIWSVVSLEAVYGTNTGPFCRIKACKVRPSGILSETAHEFWSHSHKLKKIQPFWKPNTWRQIVKSDPCLLNEQVGTVLQVESDSRRAIILIEGKEHRIKKLKEIQVPISRFENKIT